MPISFVTRSNRLFSRTDTETPPLHRPQRPQTPERAQRSAQSSSSSAFTSVSSFLTFLAGVLAFFFGLPPASSSPSAFLARFFGVDLALAGVFGAPGRGLLISAMRLGVGVGYLPPSSSSVTSGFGSLALILPQVFCAVLSVLKLPCFMNL